MWQKEDYQEHMLGYLGGLQTEIERTEPTRIRWNDLDQVYEELEIALEQLWRLISASEVDWERFRYPLELSCDSLLRRFYRIPRADALKIPVRFITIESYETQSHVQEQVEMLG